MATATLFVLGTNVVRPGETGQKMYELTTVVPRKTMTNRMNIRKRMADNVMQLRC